MTTVSPNPIVPAGITPEAPAFVLAPNPTVQWPVTVKVPTDGGTFVARRFVGSFRVLPEDDYLVLFQPRDASEEQKRTIKEALDEYAEILPRILVGWDVKDPAGAPVGIEHLPAILRSPYGRPLVAGINDAIAEIRFGIPAQPSATLGNLPPAPGTGSGAQHISEGLTS